MASVSDALVTHTHSHSHAGRRKPSHCGTNPVATDPGPGEGLGTSSTYSRSATLHPPTSLRRLSGGPSTILLNQILGARLYARLAVSAIDSRLATGSEGAQKRQLYCATVMPSDRQHHYTTPQSTRTIGHGGSAPTEYLTSSARANAPSAPGTAPPLTGPIRNKPRHSKSLPAKQLSQSLSTPQLRGPIMSESELDKKRNKLGYQRISIACGKSHPFLVPPLCGRDACRDGTHAAHFLLYISC